MAKYQAWVALSFVVGLNRAPLSSEYAKFEKLASENKFNLKQLFDAIVSDSALRTEVINKSPNYDEFIKQAYQTLMGRTPDEAGFKYWSAAANKEKPGLSVLMEWIIGGADVPNNPFSNDSKTITNKIEVAKLASKLPASVGKDYLKNLLAKTTASTDIKSVAQKIATKAANPSLKDEYDSGASDESSSSSSSGGSNSSNSSKESSASEQANKAIADNGDLANIASAQAMLASANQAISTASADVSAKQGAYNAAKQALNGLGAKQKMAKDEREALNFISSKVIELTDGYTSPTPNALVKAIKDAIDIAATTEQKATYDLALAYAQSALNTEAQEQPLSAIAVTNLTTKVAQAELNYTKAEQELLTKQTAAKLAQVSLASSEAALAAAIAAKQKSLADTKATAIAEVKKAVEKQSATIDSAITELESAQVANARQPFTTQAQKDAALAYAKALKDSGKDINAIKAAISTDNTAATQAQTAATQADTAAKAAASQASDAATMAAFYMASLNLVIAKALLKAALDAAKVAPGANSKTTVAELKSALQNAISTGGDEADKKQNQQALDELNKASQSVDESTLALAKATAQKDGALLFEKYVAPAAAAPAPSLFIAKGDGVSYIVDVGATNVANTGYAADGKYFAIFPTGANENKIFALDIKSNDPENSSIPTSHPASAKNTADMVIIKVVEGKDNSLDVATFISGAASTKTLSLFMNDNKVLYAQNLASGNDTKGFILKEPITLSANAKTDYDTLSKLVFDTNNTKLQEKGSPSNTDKVGYQVVFEAANKPNSISSIHTNEANAQADNFSFKAPIDISELKKDGAISITAGDASTLKAPKFGDKIFSGDYGASASLIKFETNDSGALTSVQTGSSTSKTTYTLDPKSGNVLSISIGDTSPVSYELSGGKTLSQAKTLATASGQGKPLASLKAASSSITKAGNTYELASGNITKLIIAGTPAGTPDTIVTPASPVAYSDTVSIASIAAANSTIQIGDFSYKVGTATSDTLDNSLISEVSLKGKPAFSLTQTYGDSSNAYPKLSDTKGYKLGELDGEIYALYTISGGSSKTYIAGSYTAANGDKVDVGSVSEAQKATIDVKDSSESQKAKIFISGDNLTTLNYNELNAVSYIDIKSLSASKNGSVTISHAATSGDNLSISDLSKTSFSNIASINLGALLAGNTPSNMEVVNIIKKQAGEIKVEAGSGLVLATKGTGASLDVSTLDIATGATLKLLQKNAAAQDSSTIVLNSGAGKGKDLIVSAKKALDIQGYDISADKIEIGSGAVGTLSEAIALTGINDSDGSSEAKIKVAAGVISFFKNDGSTSQSISELKKASSDGSAAQTASEADIIAAIGAALNKTSGAGNANGTYLLQGKDSAYVLNLGASNANTDDDFVITLSGVSTAGKITKGSNDSIFTIAQADPSI